MSLHLKSHQNDILQHFLFVVIH